MTTQKLVLDILLYAAETQPCLPLTPKPWRHPIWKAQYWSSPSLTLLSL